MNESEIRAKLAALAARQTELGVKSLSLFGSVARGEADEGSDLDFLVEFDGPATFDRYMGLKEMLEEAFERRIDLVRLRALKPTLKDKILGEAIRVA